MSFIEKASKAAAWYERFEYVLAGIAGCTIIIMAFTTVYEGIARYVFRSPTAWNLELNSVLLVYFAFLSGAWVLAAEGHVRVDILYGRFAPKTKAAIDVVTFAIALAFIGVLTWKSLDMSLYSLSMGARSQMGMQWPLFPVQIVIPIGSGLVGLQIIVKICRDLHLLFSSAPGASQAGKH